MLNIHRLTLITVLFAMFFIVPAASAHRPEQGVEAGPTIIPDSTTSFAYYRQLEGSKDVHAYTFEGQEGRFFHAGINIPQIGGLEDFQVALALLGPGLPALNSSQHNSTSHDHSTQADEPHSNKIEALSIPAGFEALAKTGMLLENQDGEDFFEPFTQTRYWGRQQVDLYLPESGTYTILIWNPEGELGKYVLDTGTEEVFSPMDLLRFPKWWLDTRLYFEQGASLAGAASVLFFGFAGLVFYWVRKR